MDLNLGGMQYIEYVYLQNNHDLAQSGISTNYISLQRVMPHYIKLLLLSINHIRILMLPQYACLYARIEPITWRSLLGVSTSCRNRFQTLRRVLEAVAQCTIHSSSTQVPMYLHSPVSQQKQYTVHMYVLQVQ